MSRVPLWMGILPCFSDSARLYAGAVLDALQQTQHWNSYISSPLQQGSILSGLKHPAFFSLRASVALRQEMLLKIFSFKKKLKPAAPPPDFSRCDVSENSKCSTRLGLLGSASILLCPTQHLMKVIEGRRIPWHSFPPAV